MSVDVYCLFPEIKYVLKLDQLHISSKIVDIQDLKYLTFSGKFSKKIKDYQNSY